MGWSTIERMSPKRKEKMKRTDQEGEEKVA